MQDIIGSLRRSLVFRSALGENGGGGGTGFGEFVEKMNSTIRNSHLGLFSKQGASPVSPSRRQEASGIRWRKGELIGCGAFGRVYMGMNLDSGELLAVKQVLIAANSASKEKTQAHIRELEEEVKLLKNLSHPNIVRYLGTAREDDSLNILLEFVPGGSISSLLGKFGSFPESVIRMYTKQLLLGLEYLHTHGIMHRDIKGANILVDNKGCIKLADFGASKKVEELVTINGAKSMKGTPYWMAPEVILQTGHSFSADVWSVGCTVIEMATGKPPWSQQYQEVAALFHIGMTKAHPPIPEHLSSEVKDFLQKCLQQEPSLRPSASELLHHPFVTEVSHNLVVESENQILTPALKVRNSSNSLIGRSSCTGLKDVCELSSMRCFTAHPEYSKNSRACWLSDDIDDMCQIDDIDDLSKGATVRFSSVLESAQLNKSFNPMVEPLDDLSYKNDENLEIKRNGSTLPCFRDHASTPGLSGNVEKDFTSPSGCSATEDGDEVTESKIRAFLDEKALELEKLKTPLYEQCYSIMNSGLPIGTIENKNGENLPPKGKSPKQLPSRRFSIVGYATNKLSPGVRPRPVSKLGSSIRDRALQEILPTQPDDLVDLVGKQETLRPSMSFLERQRKWKEELDEELQRTRERLRRAGIGGKTPSSRNRS